MELGSLTRRPQGRALWIGWLALSVGLGLAAPGLGAPPKVQPASAGARGSPAKGAGEPGAEVEDVFARPKGVLRPRSFSAAKKVALKHVYRGRLRTFYCDHPFSVEVIAGRERAVLAPDSDHYSPRRAYTRRGDPNPRANRVEWEHVAPAHSLGQHLPCWREGGRKACQRDPVFRALESDLYNLVPAIGEVNGDRSNYRFMEAPYGLQRGQYGVCPFQVDFKAKRAYPPDHAKGQIARTYLYMSETYDLSLGRQERQLMEAWHRRYPPTEWEQVRAARIEAIQGTRNRFVWEVAQVTGGPPEAGSAPVEGSGEGGELGSGPGRWGVGSLLSAPARLACVRHPPGPGAPRLPPGWLR